ncbi:hypothetical protein DFR52_106307 [Hoeflea marina]|uniref:Alpha/beta hydrolase family protein n=1 Tax=Hoeflea marina TaxID=274592 RepID=A0A317PFS5_9HYPH|nr:hypothetical protein [Hoeflea marina]PWV97782.1 hypothetical protein DFR52_106307 [Hoeflea marina]
MSTVPYRSAAAENGILEAHDILAGGPDLERPLTCRWPAERPPLGVVVFCHGLGSGPRHYGALSRHWASNGYLVVHPGFDDAIEVVARAEPELGLDPQADLSNWSTVEPVRARMHEILHAPDRWMGRLAVVRATARALPEILEATAGALRQPVPRAIAGHSFGAYTAQLLAGAEIDLPGLSAQRFSEPGFAAAILLSAQGRAQQGLRDGSWAHIDGPLLNVTGTLDRGANGGDWRWKCEPYDLAPDGGKYLAVLEGADHFLGGFTETAARGAGSPAQSDAVRQLTLAFLDAHLPGRPAARDWLASVTDRIGDCPVLYKRK